MNTENQSARPGRDALSGDNRLLGASLVGGGLAWLLHLLLSYLVAEAGCLVGLQKVQMLGITAIAWLLLFVTVVTLTGAAGATYLAYRIGQEAGKGEDREGRGTGAGAFTARTALITNLIFLFVIMVESIPIFYFLQDC